MTTVSTDGRRQRGDESRRMILTEAVNLASVHGLDGLSIGILAERVQSSKSGVVSLFGSKRDLQLAAVAAARDIFIASVIEPALREPRGLPRVWALCHIWLEYSRRRTFTGGCFFLATAVGANSSSGPVRDALVRIDEEWIAFVERCVLLAADDLPTLRDSSLLAFELIALMNAANGGSLLHGSERPYGLAEAAIRACILAAGADPEALKSRPD
ncbi:MAG: TetR/AcrR family transcriptional regulator [Terrimesophilobacter sp.]